MNAKIVLGELNVLLRLTLRINKYVQEGFILQSANLIVQNVKRLSPAREMEWTVQKHVKMERIVTIQHIQSLALLVTNVLVVLWQSVGKDIILMKVQLEPFKPLDIPEILK